MPERFARKFATILCLAALTVSACVNQEGSGGDEGGEGGQASAATDDYRLLEVWRFQSNDASPETQLAQVGYGTALPNGNFVLPDMRQGVIRLFDKNGKLLKLAAAQGRGPGEFDTPLATGVIGDTVWVIDWTSPAEFELFDLDLRPIGKTIGWDGGGIGMIAGGSILALTRPRAATQGRIFLDVIDTAGQIARTIAVDTTPRTERHRFLLPGRVDSTTSPITAYSSVSILPNGREAIVMEQGDLFQGPADEITMRRVNLLDGSVSEPKVLRVPARNVSDTDRDTIVQRMSKEFEGILNDSYRMKVRIPSSYPSFNRFFTGIDTTLWFAGFHNDTTFLIMKPSGETVGRLHVSPKIRLLEVSISEAWGYSVEENGAPTLYKFRIIRK